MADSEGERFVRNSSKKDTNQVVWYQRVNKYSEGSQWANLIYYII